ncbi:DUF3298 and DUF4163 domain-containing protein [Hymenobacter sp. 15J16-1T3B]|uniref:DUF3298 and DUF4163 domain-containing protein n=1 Tax=Hymenobacter sp. 15J16-1T3B TaxID=2886941 RepID=UPI001D1080A6|nr:DUF3298 and DUF4163 domain-containing protein [Hymenobacter sp. 15J16-1T3B]MCC3157407.1 DUF3298 and DUF4163 domain-containing protein [Hymenobacter sp. 15J16-1T3B]
MPHPLRFASARWGCLALGLLAACHSRQDAGTATTAPPAAPPAAAAVPADSPGAWYRQYRGLLPGTADSITLHLQAWPRQANDSESAGVAGSYTGPDGHPYELFGDYEAPASADSFVLVDYSPEHNPGENNAGIRWQLRRNGPALTGTVGGQPVRLREARPLSSLPLTARFFQDSVAAYPGQAASPHAQLRLLALLPGGTSKAAAALRDNLLRHLRGDTLETQAAPTLEKLWQQRRQEYARDYQQDAKERQGEATGDSLPSYALRYDSQELMRVLWNRAPLLSLGYFRYSYTGGAHGSYTTDVLTYDTRNGRPLHFDDLFRPGANAQLGPLLDAAARRSFGLAPDAPLDGPLFEKHVPATTNVFLTDGGATFVYGPYELASFAQGEIRLFLSFEELKPLLQPGLPIGADVARH